MGTARGYAAGPCSQALRDGSQSQQAEIEGFAQATKTVFFLVAFHQNPV